MKGFQGSILSFGEPGFLGLANKLKNPLLNPAGETTLNSRAEWSWLFRTSETPIILGGMKPEISIQRSQFNLQTFSKFHVEEKPELNHLKKYLYPLWN